MLFRYEPEGRERLRKIIDSKKSLPYSSAGGFSKKAGFGANHFKFLTFWAKSNNCYGMVKELNDEMTLWQSFKQGDRHAFHQLYHQHFNSLFEYGCRLAADRELVRDAIHDLFVKIWTNKATLGNVTAVRSYLLVSMRGIIYNKLQRNNRLVTGMEEKDHPFQLVFSVESEYIKKETSSAQTTQLLEAMNQLSPRQKEVIYLRYIEELDYDEVADIMGITVKATYKLSARGLETLRELLKLTPAALLVLLAGAGFELLRRYSS